MSSREPAIGRPHRHYRLTDSTNERAKALALAGAPGGLVVTADEQTAGRGRRGRTWFGPPGSSLLYSALIRPFSGDPLLSLAVPLAVCEAAESLAAVRCRVKWPNDVWIDDRKLAGALVETHISSHGGGSGTEGSNASGDWAVIGIGLNVTVDTDEFPEELREAATSLAIAAANAELTVAAAISMINQRLGHWVAASSEEVIAEFRRRDALEGHRITWDGGDGVASGIDEDGHLLVETGDGERTALGAGEVHLSVED